MDLFGPTTYKSLGENLYCLVIVDDYSTYTWVFFLHDKIKVVACFKKFAKRAQNEFEVKLKKIRSDNGKEFDNTNIEAILAWLKKHMMWNLMNLTAPKEHMRILMIVNRISSVVHRGVSRDGRFVGGGARN